MTRFRALIDRWDLHAWSTGWRGPALAALVALFGGLPGLIAMPVLDRDEARFAQASAQMLESGDIVSIRFQDEPRNKKPVGAYWMQAASVSLFSSAEARQIWAYRIPSLIGAMLAAWACAWGAGAFWGSRRGFIAGAVLGGGLLLSTEAFIGKADALMTGLIVLAMAALGRIYGAARAEPIRDGWTVKAAFWFGLAGAMLVKGPIAPMVIGLTLLALWAWDRKIAWLRHIGWGWGLALTLLIVGPWAWAITVATDGAFFSDAVTGDMLSKLHASGQEGHGAPPGLHLLLSSILSFPATFLLPAALVYGWLNRTKTGVRFALCWLVPAWIAFEIAPTKLPHYVLPLYGALAWLIAAALTDAIGRRVRYGGAILGMIVAGALAAGLVYAARLYGGPAAIAWSIIAALLMTGAGLAGAILLLMKRAETALLTALALAVSAHAAVAAGIAPNLTPLWLAQRMSHALTATGLDPRNGITPGPVAVAGLEEPSVVFKLGTGTEFTDAVGAAEASSGGRPVFVDRARAPQFLAALDSLRGRALPAGEIKGINYSKGKPVDLILYRSLIAPPDEADDEGDR